jgi:DNA-binding NarL/FixJ family response regulator
MDYTFNQREHCKVNCFLSGKDCVEHLTEDPDLIVLDYYLEETGIYGSGKEVLKEILKRSPQSKVIMFSAQENEEVIKELLNIGAWKYIKKDSFFIDSIMEAIHELRIRNK